MSGPKNRVVLALGGLGLVLAALLLWRPCSSSSGTNAGETALFDAGRSSATTQRDRPTLSPIKGSGAYALDGFVRDGAGQPVPRAQVTATLELGPGVQGTTPTDAKVVVAVSGIDGAFKLEGLESGRHRLRIEGEGLLAAELRFVEAPGQGLVILVSREVAISGRLTGASGDPTSVSVFLRSETQTRHEQQRAGTDGTFSFANLAEGRYQLWAQGVGQAASIQWVDHVGIGPFADVAVPMQPAYSVSGRVVEAGGSGLGLMTDVVVRSATGAEPERRALSGEDGQFTVDGLLEGAWSASASAPGYLASAGQSFRAEEHVSLLLEIKTGGQVVGVIRAANGGARAGAVVELLGKGPQGEEIRYAAISGAAAGNALPTTGQQFIKRGELGVLLGPIPLVPPPGAYVSRIATGSEDAAPADPESGATGNPSQFVSDALGRFRVSGVEAGRYRLRVRHNDYAESVSKLFIVRGGGAAVVRDVSLLSGTRLTGQVLSEDGVAIPGASVIARFSDSRDEALAVSDDDGNFAFGPLTGALELVVESVGFGRASRRLKLSRGGLVAANKNVEVRLVRADRFIEGRVVDSAGFPVRGASVAVVDSERALPVRPARSSDDGLFRLDGLVPGSHVVAVTHPEFPPLEIKLAPAPDVEIVVPLGAALTVEVKDRRTGAAQAMADVRLTRAGETIEKRGITDAAGRAGFPVLRPGKWTIAATLKGFAVESTTAVLVAKPSRRAAPHIVPIALSRGSVLAGMVVDADGERVEGAVLSCGASLATTDAQGRFRLEDVESGVVELTIVKDGLVSRERLDLESGEERVTMQLRFVPTDEPEGAGNANGSNEPGLEIDDDEAIGDDDQE